MSCSPCLSFSYSPPRSYSHQYGYRSSQHDEGEEEAESDVACDIRDEADDCEEGGGFVGKREEGEEGGFVALLSA